MSRPLQPLQKSLLFNVASKSHILYIYVYIYIYIYIFKCPELQKANSQVLQDVITSEAGWGWTGSGLGKARDSTAAAAMGCGLGLCSARTGHPVSTQHPLPSSHCSGQHLGLILRHNFSRSDVHICSLHFVWCITGATGAHLGWGSTAAAAKGSSPVLVTDSRLGWDSNPAWAKGSNWGWGSSWG